MTQLSRIFIAGLLATFVATPLSAQDSTEKQHPLEPAIRIAQAAQKAIAEEDGYEAVLTKRELLGRRVIQQRMRMKIRHEPFSVYLYFNSPHRGREVIYVDGKNGGNLLAHETGLAALVGTVRLKPTSSTAMRDNRYPVTEIGMKRLVELLVGQWENEKAYGEIGRR